MVRHDQNDFVKPILLNNFLITKPSKHSLETKNERMPESDLCFFYNHKISFIIISDHSHIFKNANREKQIMPKCHFQHDKW